MEVGQNNISNARNIKVTTIYNDLGTVKNLSRLMPHEDKIDFQVKYEHILDLLNISVEESVLSALTQFWKAPLHCFELPNLDMMPTIEEYITMVRLPIREKAGVYLYQGSYVSETKVAKLIGIPANTIVIEERGTTRGLSQDFLESHLETLAQRKEWHLFKRTLALLIYGLVLFPFTPNIVDQASMDVFFRYCTYGANPVPAILADTFLSVDVCHRKKGGKLRCCLHMLYVWVMTHVQARNHLGRLPDPLKNFHRIPIKQQPALSWIQEFSEIDPNTFKWVCPWYHGESIIYSCGNFPYVPLMGPRGCISYSPALVLRQLCWTQTKPQREQLESYSFLYQKNQDTKKQELEIKKAWGSIEATGKGRLGKQRPTSSTEYEEWRRTRIRQDDAPKKTLRPEESDQEQLQSIPQMNSYIEVLEAQIRFLEDQKQESDLQVIILQDRCQKKVIEIKKLKDEYADSLEATQARIGKGHALMAVKLQNLERKLRDLSKEKKTSKKKSYSKTRQTLT